MPTPHLQACLLAFGPFKQEIVEALPLENATYAAVPDGTLVSTTLFKFEDEQTEHELAEALGVHLEDIASYSRIAELAKFIDWDALDELHPQDSDTLNQLLTHGFTIIFQPIYPDDTATEDSAEEVSDLPQGPV